MSYNLLKGKRGIIFGALNSESIAWKVAERAVEEGAQIVLTNTAVSLRLGEIKTLAEKCNAPIIAADATNLEEIEALVDKTLDYFGGKIDLNADFLTEERHLFALQQARDSLCDAINAFSITTADLCAIDITSAWSSLGEVSGETANEAIIDEIFSKFCVGK